MVWAYGMALISKKAPNGDDLLVRNEQAPKKPGRLEVEFNLTQIERLGRIQCTDAEIAAVLDVSVYTLMARKADNPTFAAALARGRAAGKASLRRMQWQGAMNGDPTMLIWLGKQVLGQVQTTNLNIRKVHDWTDLSDDELSALAQKLPEGEETRH